ncbi:MAG: hypothetical protein P8Y07_05440 [Gemmatimonadales bacterium]
MRSVDNAVLIPDTLDDLFDRQAHRNPLTQEEADQLGPTPAANLFADDHEIRCQLACLESTVYLAVIRHSDAVEAGVARSQHQFDRS